MEFQFDPFRRTGLKIKNKDRRDRARQEIADFIKEQILIKVGGGASPVKNGKWTRQLTASYLREKLEETGISFSNLELSGEMLDALESRLEGDRKVAVGISGDQAGKADGNNRGTYGRSGGTRSRRREFIPRSGQTFDDVIMAGIERIITNHMTDEDG